MNHYELLTLVSGRFAENEVEPVFQKIEAILKKYECPIHYRQNLDRKRLAYPIDHQLYGYYFLMEFDADGTAVAKIDREMKLASDVLRHTLVKRKTVGKPKTSERKVSLEQEAFGKTFDRAKLGLDDVLDTAAQPVPDTHSTRSVPVTPSPAAPTVVDATGVQTPEIAEPEVGQQPTPVSEEPAEKAELIQPAPAAKTIRKKSAEGGSASGGKEKKTEDKVSFEELDKKLEDILKNDIL